MQTERGAAKIPTSVPGLDEVLLGGLVRDGLYLIQGDPGAGKTTFALQYLHGRARLGERCLYVSLTESRQDLTNVCDAHGWSLDAIDICDLVRPATAADSEASVYHPSDTELGDIIKALVAEVERLKPAHVVLDGLSELRLLSGDPLRYRRQLLWLKDFFAERHITIVLLDDRTAAFGEIKPESLVGGNIVLERMLPVYGRARRRLFVTKVRASNFREGYHEYDIVTGGIVVHPRIVAAEHHDRFARSLTPSGIQQLDDMLQGGLASGTTSLLLGPAGAGKSTISMQYVVNALAAGKKAAVYIFDEVLGTLVERSEKLCLGKEGGLRSFISEGLLHVQQIDPAEMSPGAFAHEVRRAVEDGASIIVIDSLNGYMNAMPEESFLTTHLHELFAYLNQKGVTTIMVVAQHGLVLGTGALGEIDVSYLADTVLLFRYFESRGEIRQAISVFKHRTGPHERTLRQLKIDRRGVQVGDKLGDFNGIITGVPQYAGAASLLNDRESEASPKGGGR
jgi:circadian clock protein KaiC